jgi:hypothetical protein
MKDGAAAGPVNHLLLRLDAPGGGEDRIRIDLRGSTLEATLNIENAGEAERIASRIGELRESLSRLGLEADVVKVRTTLAPGAERLDGTRTAFANAADLESGRNNSNSRSGADSADGRDAWRDSQGRSRREAGDSHQRSRREPRQEENA